MIDNSREGDSFTQLSVLYRIAGKLSTLEKRKKPSPMGIAVNIHGRRDGLGAVGNACTRLTLHAGQAFAGFF
jgi:hypothetical protein